MNAFSSLQEIERRASELANRICAPSDALPGFGEPKDFGYPHVEVDASGYHWIVTERGAVFEKRTTLDIDELLYWIMRPITARMASSWEVSRRVANIDFRRLTLSQEIQLLSHLGADMVRRWAADISAILMRSPFEDECL
jgi:Immunity protein 63